MILNEVSVWQLIANIYKYTYKRAKSFSLFFSRRSTKETAERKPEGIVSRIQQSQVLCRYFIFIISSHPPCKDGSARYITYTLEILIGSNMWKIVSFFWLKVLNSDYISILSYKQEMRQVTFAENSRMKINS